MYVCVCAIALVDNYLPIRNTNETKKKIVYILSHPALFFSLILYLCLRLCAFFLSNPITQIKSHPFAKLIGSVQKPQIGQPKHVASMNGNATIINALIMTFCAMVPKIVQTTPMKGLFV